LSYCGSTFTIPKNGVEQLPSNFFIKQLVDIQKASYKPTDTESCEGCSEKSQDLASAEMLKSQGTFCRQHTTNRLEHYCFQCHQNICLACHVTKYPNDHHYKDINEIYKHFRLTIEQDLQRVLDLETNVVQLSSQTDSAHKQFEDHVKEVENAIQRNARELKNQIDKVVDELLKELAGIETASLKVMNDAIDGLQLQLISLQSFTRYCNELLNSGKPCDITHGFNGIHTRASELLKQDKVKNVECQLPEINVTGDDFYNKLSAFIPNHFKG
jgi:hypothetical protein